MRFLSLLKQAGTGSFRLAAAAMLGYGGNAQNFNKQTADIFEVPPEFRIVQPDQSGAEALVVAYMAEKGKYRELFTENVKPHVYVALHLFLDKFRGEFARDRYWLKRPGDLKKLPEWKRLESIIKKSKFEYDIGKRTGHAKNYKMGPSTFREATLKESEGSLNLTFDEALYYLTTYEELFPEILVLQAKIEEIIKRDRLLRNMFGHPRRFERIITPGYLREGISWVPQSTVGCITHEAYLKTYQFIRKEGLSWKLINNKHDSLAVMTRTEESVECGRIVSGFMAKRMIGWDGTEFTMKSEVQIGRNFKKYDSETNPNGLQEVKYEN